MARAITLSGCALLALFFAAPIFAQTTPTTVTGTTPPSDVARELEALKRSVDVLGQRVNSGTSQVKDWAPVVAAILTAAVAIYSLRRTTGQSMAINLMMLTEKAREEKRKSIRTQIDEFYGPFLRLRHASKYVYDEAFMPRRTKEEKEQYCDETGRYRTLIAMVKGFKFSDVDQVLLQQIIAYGKATAELIRNKIGLVDDPEVLAVLGKAIAHFAVIEEANKGTLKGGGDEFHKFTFPTDLDDLVKRKFTALNTQLKQLETPSAGDK
jgi:hypothetical protein